LIKPASLVAPKWSRSSNQQSIRWQKKLTIRYRIISKSRVCSLQSKFRLDLGL